MSGTETAAYHDPLFGGAYCGACAARWAALFTPAPLVPAGLAELRRRERLPAGCTLKCNYCGLVMEVIPDDR